MKTKTKRSKNPLASMEGEGLFRKLVGKHLPWNLTQLQFFTTVFGGILIVAMLLRIFAKQPLTIGSEAYLFSYFLKQTSLNKIYLQIGFIIPILLGVFSIYFYGKILLLKKCNRNIVGFSLLLFAVSPLYIYTFTSNNHMAIILSLAIYTFALLFTDMFTAKKKKKSMLSLIAFLIIAFLDITASLIYLFFVITYWKKGKFKATYDEHIRKYIKGAFFIFAITLIINIISKGYLFIDQLFTLRGLFYTENWYYALFSDFGALWGFSLFYLLLLIIGFLLLWKERKEYGWGVFVLLVSLFVYLYLDVRYAVMVTPLFIPIAGFAFKKLWYLKWKVAMIRDFCLLLFVLGCIFSATAFVSRYPLLEPQAEFMQGVNELNLRYGNLDATLLTHPKYIPYLEATTEFTLFSDQQAIDTIFHKRRIDEVDPLLEEGNIRFILITEEMRSGLVWEERVQLLFLLDNSKNFKKRFENAKVEVWEHKKGRSRE
jgi:hypothetical protein